LGNTSKPSLSELTFVQIDEFYPISSKQHNSFYDYVNRFYLSGFGLSKEKAILINSDEIRLADGKHFSKIFPDLKVDLSLRFRDPINELEQRVVEVKTWATSDGDKAVCDTIEAIAWNE
jgi:glucosamine-6-phosphate deaminase